MVGFQIGPFSLIQEALTPKLSTGLSFLNFGLVVESNYQQNKQEHLPFFTITGIILKAENNKLFQ